MDMLIIRFHLIQSALSQKVEAEPVGLAYRECSQGHAEMRGREVASLPGRMESPMGWNHERAASGVAKFDLSALNATGRAAANAVSGVTMVPVRPATTFDTGNVRFTDEIPRRPALTGRVNLGYKFRTKGWGDASEAGTVSPRPRPKGCQQRQSRGGYRRFTASACSERQNLRVPPGPLRCMGPVSPATTATKWRDGTSSRLGAGSLSNSPQPPEAEQAAIRSR